MCNCSATHAYFLSAVAALLSPNRKIVLYIISFSYLFINLKRGSFSGSVNISVNNSKHIIVGKKTPGLCCVYSVSDG